MKRLLSLLLTVALLLSCLPLTSFAQEDEPIVLLLASDYQNYCYTPSYNRYYYDATPIADQPRTQEFQAILDAVAADGVSVDAALLVGDYTDHFQSDGDGDYCSGDGIRQIKSMLRETLGVDPENTVFSQGNHDYELAEGIAKSGLQPYDEDDEYLVYVINEGQFPYSQRTASYESLVSATAQTVNEDLRALVNSHEDRPIMLLCHVPLHYSTRYNGKDNTYANLIFEAINEAAEELNIFFFYGHNHSGSSADYEADWGGAVNYVARGQALDINCAGHGKAGANLQTLNFTYLNAGYVGYSTSVVNDTKTVSVLSVYSDRVVISRYDKDGEYTRVESLGMTDPRDESKGEVTTYPITVTLQNKTNYTLTVESLDPAYGTVTAQGWFAEAVPTENYAVESWTLTPSDGAQVTQDGNRFYFSDITADCTLSVRFCEVSCASARFSDVDTTQWYHDSIDYALVHGLFNGMSATEFWPDGTMTRAMLVTVLYRLSGSPAIVAGNDFTDVSSADWYATAVTWAKVIGVVDGMGDGTFRPEDDVTREQTAVILYRYAKYRKLNVGKSDAIEGFTDADAVNDWAQSEMSWAIRVGLINGMGNGTLDPQGNTTRAQVATLLMRFCLNILEK